MSLVLTGYVHRLAQPITPGQIIAPAHATSGDPALLAAHCLETIAPHLADQARPGDVLVLPALQPDSPTPAGNADSRHAAHEPAILALQALGIAALICAAAPEDVCTLAGNYGLPVLLQPEATAALPAGAIVRLDLARGRISQTAPPDPAATWHTTPCPPDVLAAVQRTLLLSRMRRVVEDEGYAD